MALPEFDPVPCPDPDFAQATLNAEQSYAARAIEADLNAREFSVSLLDGVTGSGKTETYFDAVAEAIRLGKQVLILLPEIALTVQFLDRFAERFGCRPAEWHSDLSQKERRRIYRAVMKGEARVVVGARSALFLPFPELGLIIVDEEHEQAYKQEDGVIYHARDMAVVRGRIENCPGGAGERHALARNLCECRKRPLSLAEAHRPAWRRHHARGEADRFAARTRRARHLAVAALARGVAGNAGCAANRRCCSSTAAAMRR